MARGKKKEKELSPEERLQQALVPESEQPYKVPENWRWTRVKALCNLKNGRAFKPVDWSEVGLPIVRIQNLNNPENAYNHYNGTVENDYRLYGGELLFAWSGTPGTSFGAHIWWGKDAVLNQHIFRVDFDERYVNKRFFMYAINQRLDMLISVAHGGAGLQHVTKGVFENTAIAFPPLPEQQRIVDRIESLFAKLDEAKEKAQAVVDGFEDRKAAILHKAFSGELIGLSRGNTVPLSTIVDTIRIGPFGSTLHKEDYVLGGVPVINPKHIVNQQIVPDVKVTITNEKADELGSYRLKSGDIVMGRRGEMGRSAPVTAKENGWLCGTGSLIIRLQEGYDAAFYSQIIASHTSVQFLEENCVGSTMNNLNEKIVKSLPMPDYSKEEQRLIVAILVSVFEKEEQAYKTAEQIVDQIETMKKTILAHAFRGELGTNDPTEESAEELLKRILYIEK